MNSIHYQNGKYLRVVSNYTCILDYATLVFRYDRTRDDFKKTGIDPQKTYQLKGGMVHNTTGRGPIYGQIYLGGVDTNVFKKIQSHNIEQYYSPPSTIINFSEIDYYQVSFKNTIAADAISHNMFLMEVD